METPSLTSVLAAAAARKPRRAAPSGGGVGEKSQNNYLAEVPCKAGARPGNRNAVKPICELERRIRDIEQRLNALRAAVRHV